MSSEMDGTQTQAVGPTQAVRIRLFAQLREQAGWQERWYSMDHQNPSPLTPASLWIKLALPGSLSDMRIAINQQFAEADTSLKPGDELAFLSPISGG